MLGVLFVLSSPDAIFAQTSQPISPQFDASKTGAPPAPKPLSAIEIKKRRANAIVVSLMVSSLPGTASRFAEDIRHTVDDLSDGGVRVLPILGQGGPQNLEDLLLLTGIDMAVVDQDHLEYLKDANPELYGNIDQVVRYIARLYNSEIHILARMPVKRLADLKGKRVSFNLRNSQAHVAGMRLFQMAGLEVERSFYDDYRALEALRSGELEAHIIVTGAPQTFVSALKSDDAIHLVPIAEDDLPRKSRAQLYERYLPSSLTHDHYPELIAKDEAVPTIATRTLLAVYKWPKGSFRYRRIKRFVQAFFDKAEALKHPARHSKWLEMNLAAEVPGWQRFEAAKDWLDEHRQSGPAATAALAAPDEKSMRSEFNKFLTYHLQSSGNGQVSDKDTGELFVKFKRFIASQDVQTGEK
jgi:TRAP-type uncharacterized transport system substrate-binding protein